VAVFILLGLASSIAAQDGVGVSGEWTYQADIDALRPIARTIGVTEDRPQDIVEKSKYRGTVRRYAQLRYGSENSRRVVIVIDELAEDGYDFYVDFDRDRTITADELVAGDGRSRTFDLAAEIIHEDQPEQDDRRVRVRLSVTRTRISVATLGCVEGYVPWASSEGSTISLCVRRVDGNANGLFADARDRVLLDLDQNQQWDPVDEQFPCLPVQTIANERYAVRSDRLGHRFTLSRITGVGQLRVVLASLPASARISAFEAMAFAEDGSAYSLKQPNDPLSVPTGRYTLGSVSMTIDAGEREPWHFVFSRANVEDDDWVSIEPGQQISLKAVGKPSFVLNTKSDAVRPGDSLTVNPRLYTEDGLLINLSSRGRQMGSFASERYHNRCTVRLSAEGKTLSAATSGFA
jgi:hypothetical protein